jgi:hypothetical protein
LNVSAKLEKLKSSLKVSLTKRGRNQVVGYSMTYLNVCFGKKELKIQYAGVGSVNALHILNELFSEEMSTLGDHPPIRIDHCQHLASVVSLLHNEHWDAERWENSLAAWSSPGMMTTTSGNVTSRIAGGLNDVGTSGTICALKGVRNI